MGVGSARTVRARTATLIACATLGVVGLAACGSTEPKNATTSAAAGAPQTEAELVTGSKHEKGLLVYSNALLAASEHVTKAFESKYPWIHVKITDMEDPVVFSKYAAEHATGASTADILIASAPGLWAGARKNGYLQNYTPAGLANFPSFTSQGGGLYVLSPDPAITIYNKLLLKGQAPPQTIQAITEGGKVGKYKVATYTIDNNFGYTAFWAFVHQKGWSTLEELGKIAKTPGDGDVLAEDVAKGAFTVAVIESGLARGQIATNPEAAKLLGWEYTTDFTPLIPRGIGITAGASSPDSAKLFLNYVYSNEGQQALCDAGFEASSKTFEPTNKCPNTLKALYAAVGGEQHTFLTPFSEQVVKEQPGFTARFNKAFGH
jgi:iron(III) transport system substrate-binding protein